MSCNASWAERRERFPRGAVRLWQGFADSHGERSQGRAAKGALQLTSTSLLGALDYGTAHFPDAVGTCAPVHTHMCRMLRQSLAAWGSHRPPLRRWPPPPRVSSATRPPGTPCIACHCCRTSGPCRQVQVNQESGLTNSEQNCMWTHWWIVHESIRPRMRVNQCVNSIKQ